MATRKLKLFRPHRLQRQILAEARRFNVVVCGRRWGKTQLGIKLITDEVLRGRPVGWFAPTYQILEGAFNEIRRLLNPIITSCNKATHTIVFATGSVLEFWTLNNEDAGRSRKYALVVVDEAALDPHLMDTWSNAIRPTLTDYRGTAWFTSTPKGMNGFRELWDRHWSGDYPQWMSWDPFPTSSNPYIHPDEVKEAQQDLPKLAFEQEYLAQFVEDAGGVFRGVMDVATLSPQDPIPGHDYVIGVDWGKKNDWTVASVIDTDTLNQVHLSRFNQISYHYQRKRIENIYARYNPRILMPESNSIGEAILDELRLSDLRVQGFETTNRSKNQIIQSLALAIETGQIHLLNDRVLISELQAYEMHRTELGNPKYGAPPGAHDDCVMATAISYHAATQGSGGLFAFGGDDWD